MPQSPWTPLVQIAIAFSALCIAAAAVIYSVSAWHEDKNARLVEIGVAVLRADPSKEPSTASARAWALDLIDANAGGIKFSPEARAELLKKALTADFSSADYGWSDISPNAKHRHP
jgi:hypothetical protein